MTNESPGFTPSWIRHGETPPLSTQETLRDTLHAAGLDPDRYAYEVNRARVEFNEAAHE